MVSLNHWTTIPFLIKILYKLLNLTALGGIHLFSVTPPH